MLVTRRRRPDCGKSSPGSVCAGREAVAAMEFGLLAPVMAILLIAVFNIAKVLILWEQCWSAARSIAETATTLAVQSSDTNTLTAAQADEAMSAVFAEIPWVTAGIATGTYTGPNRLPPNSVNVALTSVDYIPDVSSGCTTHCTYTTRVLWSKAYDNVTAGFNPKGFRPCGGPLSAPSPVPDKLGDGIAVADPFVIADVSITYTPWLFSAFLPNVILRASAYVPVRVSPANPISGDGELKLQVPFGPGVCPNALVTD